MSANVLHHYALLDIDRWKRPVLTRPGATHPRAGRWNSGAETHKQIARVLERLELASGSGPFDTALVNVNDPALVGRAFQHVRAREIDPSVLGWPSKNQTYIKRPSPWRSVPDGAVCAARGCCRGSHSDGGRGGYRLG